MVTLASCERCSISHNQWRSEWEKVNALRRETEALVCKLRTAEGRQRIVVFRSVVISELIVNWFVACFGS